MNYKRFRGFVKEAEAERDMPPFLEQDRPAKAKEVYRALKRDHPTMDAGKKARIANAVAKKKKYGQKKSIVKISAAPAQQGEDEKKPLLGRIGQGLFGSGLALSNLRNAATYANPNQTLYHGTAPANAESILRGGGLDTRFAGFAKRLNSLMLANAGGKAVMDAGISTDNALLADLAARAEAYMGESRQGGMGKFDSVAAVEQATRDVLTERGIDPAKIEDTIAKSRPELERAGKRIYMANTPRVAAMYGDEGANELHMIGKYMDASDPLSSVKLQAKTIGNLLTGGVVPEAARTYDTMKYNRQVAQAANIPGQSTDTARDLMAAMNYGDYGKAGRLLRSIDPNISNDAMTNIFNAHQRGDLGTAFGVSASRTNMKSLSDFPLLSGIMAVNPGVKYTASDLLPSLDPTKDLSVPENIPLRDFRNMDLVDVATDTPLLRMGFDNPQRKIDLAERLVGLRKAAPYAALGLLGADIAQDAVRQKGMYSAKPFKAFLDRKKKRQEKQASVLKGSTVEGLKAVGRAARSMALPAAAVGGTGFLAAKGYGAAGNYIEKQLQSPSMVAFQEAEKKRLIDEGKDPRVAENMAAKASRMAVLQAAAFPAGIGGGLLSAGISHPRTIRNIFKGQLPASGKGLISLPATAFAGYLAVPSMMGRAEEVRLGKDLSDQSPLTVPFKGSKIEKFVRDNPEYAGIPDLAVMGTIPLLTTYVGKKHYSGHAAMAAQEIDAGAAALAGAINAVGGIKPRDLMGYLRNQREEALRARRRSTKAASAIDYDRLREFLAQKEAAASKDPRLTRAGVSGYNQVKRTPGHPTKSHIVVAKEGDRVKTIRFGQQGVKTNQTAGQREAFKSRHRKNISKGKMSAAYWADKAKWSPKKTKDKDNPNWVKGS